MEARIHLKDQGGDAIKLNEILVEKVKLLNSKYVKNPTIDERLAIILKKQKALSKPRGEKDLFKLGLKALEKKAFMEFDFYEATSVRSARGLRNTDSSYKGSSYKATPSKPSVKKQPRLKFDYMYPSDLTNSIDFKKEGKGSFRDNIKLMVVNRNSRDGSKQRSMSGVVKVTPLIKNKEADQNAKAVDNSSTNSPDEKTKLKEKKVNQDDVEEIMRNFGIDRYFNPPKSVSDPSELLDVPNESVNDNLSELANSQSKKKLIRHSSLPRELEPDDSYSADESIKENVKAKREDLNSTALEGVNFNRGTNKPSKFSGFYKGN